MLDVHRLRVFSSVVASGSIQAAAAHLGYTSSAVSQHVSALQRETGLTLVSRAGRGIAPTPAGRELAARIDAVLTELGGVEALVADLRAGRAGSFSMAYFASVGAAWMPAVVATLRQRFPDVRLELALREELAGEEGRPDLQVVVERPGVRWPAGLVRYPLLDDPYVAVLPDTHRWADEATVALGSLAAEHWIDNDLAHGWCRATLLQACRSAGFDPPFAVETQDYPTALAFVAAGVGITVLPALGARRLPPGVRAVSVVNPTPVRSISAVVPAGLETSPVVEVAVGELRRLSGAGGPASAAAARTDRPAPG